MQLIKLIYSLILKYTKPYRSLSLVMQPPSNKARVSIFKDQGGKYQIAVAGLAVAVSRETLADAMAAAYALASGLPI